MQDKRGGFEGGMDSSPLSPQRAKTSPLPLAWLTANYSPALFLLATKTHTEQMNTLIND
jgi:hypothetical protein